MSQNAQGHTNGTRPKGWRARLWNRLWTARRPLRRLAILLILALIVEYLVIPELIGASRDFYLLGRLNPGWMVLGLILEAFSLFCYALLNRVLLPPEGRPKLSRLFRIDLVAAAVAHVIPAGTIGSAGIGFQLFTAEGIDGTDVGVMMATKGMGSTLVLNVLLWISLVISIPLSGFRPVYETVAVVGALLIALMAALVIGITRGEKRAARVLHAIGDRIPKLGGDRLEQIVLQAAASIRALGRNRAQLAESLTWAAMNWLLDVASLWCFIAAFGRYANPIGLFAAYGIANVLAAIPLTPGGLGIVDTVIPILLVGFGLTRSVATLGVLSWRLVNFWLPIPAGAVAYASLKVPPGRGLRAVRHAFHEMTTRGSGNHHEPERPPEPDGDHRDGRDQATLSPDGSMPQPEHRDSYR
ncbi:MAG TPA: lysylphosphatidylglycerol synthase transmembrane domain-containing protein [Streptosporangiaceae bacterium]|nr:lysylphosphatidylglycerol synthase transmembrane domain-containing protein [Streptosporangiaceae bacterium]